MAWRSVRRRLRPKRALGARAHAHTLAIWRVAPAPRIRGRGPRDVAAMTASADEQPFWRVKTLEEMSARGMGEPVRRLRALLPRQTRGRGHRRNPFHRHRLQVARRPRPAAARDYRRRRRRVPDCVKLTPEAARSLVLAARHLRLSRARRGARSGLVASARLGLARDRPRGRRFGARARQRRARTTCRSSSGRTGSSTGRTGPGAGRFVKREGPAGRCYSPQPFTTLVDPAALRRDERALGERPATTARRSLPTRP